MKKLHQRYVSRRKGSFFKKSFVMILLIACIPGLLTGAGVYLFSAAKIEKELQHLHENQVKRQISQIDDKLEGLEIMLSQLAYDPRLMNGLADADLQTDFQTTYKLSKSLFLLQDQNPLIHKVELFIQGKEPILLNPEYNGLTDRKILKAYHSLLEGGQNVYWKDMSGASSGMALVHKIPGGILEPFGALILTLDERELGRLLESLSPYSKGTALLFHHNQKPVSWSNRGKTNFESALKERLEKQKNPQGSFVMDWSGGAYSVSYGRMDRLNQEWTYVSASPMSAITAPVLFLSKLIASVSIAGIVLAFILAWYASHKIYSPVARLIKLCSGEGKAAYFPDEFHWLEKRWEDLSEESGRLKKELPHAANVFFQRLLSGYFADESERNLRDRLKRWGWEAKDNVFTIIDVQLTGLYEGNGSFTKKDESLAGFLLGNITRELAGRTFNHIYMTDVRSLSLAVLLASGRNTAFKEEIAQFVRELTDVIYSISKLHVTVTVSKTADKLKDIPGIYEEVKEGRHYRQFENASQVIDLSRREDMPPAESYYPFALEKEVVRALRLEERDEVERRIRLFIRELSEKGKTEIRIQPGMMQLFAKIQEEIFHSGLHPYELFSRKNLLQELSELREPERAVGWMMERCISPYLKEMEGKTDSKNGLSNRCLR
ncbi:cache domain-containing protein [Bacillus licheniformis]|uniref:cache domain-containing protein n=1 Tax=Bacillus licheniformis TaxID=1402 RepID=UPI004038C059